MLRLRSPTYWHVSNRRRRGRCSSMARHCHSDRADYDLLRAMTTRLSRPHRSAKELSVIHDDGSYHGYMQLHRLSPRERQCLERAAARIPYKVIAAELDLEVGTIDGYLSSGARKLGVSRREAFRIILEKSPGFPGTVIPGVAPAPDETPAPAGPRFPWSLISGDRAADTPIRTIERIIFLAALLLAALALVVAAVAIVTRPA